jgi:hypothetical protein
MPVQEVAVDGLMRYASEKVSHPMKELLLYLLLWLLS